MFANHVDFEIWEYNNCRSCLKKRGCPIRKELNDTGSAPEVTPHGLSFVCHAQERKKNPWQD